MTIIATAPGATEPPPEPDDQPTIVDGDRVAPPMSTATAAAPGLPSGSSVRIVAVWFLLTLVGVLVVLLGLSPAAQQRDQRALFADYSAKIESASNQAFGLPGVQTPTEAPSVGDPVAILDEQHIGLHSVAVEGSDPAQTREGPGHVVGTAAPGQPGNAAVVARSHLYGATFGSLADMAIGDRILVTTEEGQSAYTVRYVGHREITDASDSSAPATTTTTAAPATTTTAPAADASAAPAAPPAAAPDPPLLPDGPLTPAQLYGPTPDDRLTLVTSDSDAPWGTSDALVVVARLDGQPYAPTPQGGRTPQGDGRHGDPGFGAPLLLAALFTVAAMATSVWLYRNLPWRSAYLLSAPLVVAATIVLAETMAAALPAWA
jgi:sortase A